MHYELEKFIKLYLLISIKSTVALVVNKTNVEIYDFYIVWLAFLLIVTLTVEI